VTPRRVDTVVAGLRMAGWVIDPLEQPRADAVLVHGMVVASRSMIPLARALARRGIRCWMLDVPGMGQSDRALHVLNVDELGHVTAGWIARLGLAPAAVLANSFGTQIASAAAQRRPEAFRKLVLLSPTIPPSVRDRARRWLPRPHHHVGSAAAPPSAIQRVTGAARARAIDMMAKLMGDEPPLGLLVASGFVAAGPVVAIGTIRHAIDDAIEDRIADIKAPLVIARAEHDNIVSDEWVDDLLARARDAVRIDIPGADHDAEYLAAEAVAKALAPELTAERPARSA
jgi:pimeloyl-ACP methyl ester carboxylesterase